MALGTRLSRRARYTSMAVAFLLTAIMLASNGTPTKTPMLVAELEVDKDYQGPVSGIAFDASGEAWMATSQALYRVQGEKPQVVDIAAGREAQLTLAPGGGLYAWLVRGKVPAGLFTVELFKIPKTPIAELRLPEFPFGFGTLYLGGAGRLIVTATPLESPEGLGGEFLYAFWSSDGKMLSSVTLEGRRVGVVDVAGDALLLLGEKDAIALTNEGQPLWKLDGSFRKGALAARGRVALLNPAQAKATSEVHVFRNGKVTPIQMHSPVYDLALAADASEGAVAVGEGGLFFIAPLSCQAGQCDDPRRISLQPVDGTFLITAIHFVDRTTVALGVIQRAGTAPHFTFPGGAALAVSTSGNVLFKTNVTLVQPATWTPLIDVTYGARYFAAHTPQRALFVSLNP